MPVICGGTGLYLESLVYDLDFAAEPGDPEVREKYYNYSIKFMSLEEFSRKITFDYDEKTLYYLMKEYNINLKIRIDK